MPAVLDELCRELTATCRRIGRPIQIMEVCGTHTVSVFRSGLRSVLPENFRLISGPGCPVCVTAQRDIDAAVALAARPDVILATYGDMVRVPGSGSSLEQQRARGARVRVVYSIDDALKIAVAEHDRMVVFVGVGFETTAPATAAAIVEAHRRGLKNFCVLPGHKRVVPAMLALLADGEVPIDGFLCPGHVSVIIGANAYRPIVDRYRKPCVVAGFEPVQIVAGLLRLAQRVRRGEPALDNVYSAAVSPDGNRHALRLIDQVFECGPAVWRALGTIPDSGLDIRRRYADYDAIRRFEIRLGRDHEPPGCLCGQVIQGKITPDQCALFASRCTPTTPVGPCMVSSEGTCSAWFRYDRLAAASAEHRPIGAAAGKARS